MKNIFLGIIGMFLLLYTAVLQVGMFQINSRKNEIENCLSEVLESTLKDHYYVMEDRNPGVCENVPRENLPGYLSHEEIINQVKKDIDIRLGADSERNIIILACDMEKGILSAKVTEIFYLPGGKKMEISKKKTVIVEREEIF